jgi:hypothetical protein
VHRLRGTLICIFVLWLGWPDSFEVYSVLIHEAIVDAAWGQTCARFSSRAFPDLPWAICGKDTYTPAEARTFRTWGYYPHGNSLFRDLTHYSRSGDNVEALLPDSQDMNDYVFALGAMAHYAADNNGHRLAASLTVAMLYPPAKRELWECCNVWG